MSGEERFFAVMDAEAQSLHDMKNTAMVLHEASLQLLEDRAAMSPERVAHLCQILARRSDMLVRLLGDLSTRHLAQRGDLRLLLQSVSLADISREIVAELPPADGVQITSDIAEDAVVLADPLRVTQVLDNLVTNALRYGGPNVRLSAVLNGANVCLTVSDDGPGVSEDLVDTLFDAYVRGPASQYLGGSGLGLSIVRQLCVAMGGTVEYDDTHGTQFTATFPAFSTPVRTIDQFLGAALVVAPSPAGACGLAVT